MFIDAKVIKKMGTAVFLSAFFLIYINISLERIAYSEMKALRILETWDIIKATLSCIIW